MKATLFGPLRLQDEQQRPFPLPPTANGRTLLAYLLLHADQPHGRSHLAALLAPDDSEEKARRALTQALWQARRALPDGAIRALGDAIQLDTAQISRDVAAFDRLMAHALTAETPTAALAAQLAEGIALYHADLLNDFYDDWVYLPREQRRERYLRALELLAAWEKQNGRFSAALDYVLQLTQADPLRESAHQEALRLYAALNRPQAARQHYEQYRRYLQDEMGLNPDRQTRQLADAIAQSGQEETAVYLPASATPYALSDTAHMPLIGRDQERGQLLAQLNRLAHGQGGLLFLSGPPGVGKSRLLQELTRDADWRGLAVAYGSGRELAASAPYALFQEALGSLLTPLRWQQVRALLDDYWLNLAAPLAGMADAEMRPPDTSARGSHPTEYAHYEAFSRMLFALGQLRPLLLILDDVQWADPASLELLTYLAGRLAGQPVLVALAFRSEEARAETAVWQTLNALDAVAPHLRLRLEPLTAEATAEFITQGLGLPRPAPRFSERLFAETGGLPLLLLESLHLLHEEGLLYRDARGDWRTPFDNQTADYAELPIGYGGPSATALTARRLRQLPAHARQTLEAAAIIGKDVPFNLLAAAVEQPRPVLFAALGLLAQRQFLLETPESYCFSHDKVRQAVYQEIDPARRIRLHRQTAALVAEQTPTAVDRIAYHYRQGEQWPEALHFTLQAAERAYALSVIVAALDHYAVALQILETQAAAQAPLPPSQMAETRARILIARQSLLFTSGQTEQQEKELADLRQLVKQLPDPVWQADAALKEAHFAGEVQAQYDTAAALAREALTIAEAHQLPRRQAEAWKIIGMAGYHQGRYQESAAAYRRSVALWETLPDAAAQLMAAYAELIYNERVIGRIEEGMALAQKLLALAQAHGNQLGQASAHAAIANFYNDQGNHLASIHAYSEARAIFQRVGARLNEAKASANVGYGYWALRRYGEAIALTEESLFIFQELGAQRSVMLSYLNLAGLHYDIGQFERGNAYVADGLALATALKLDNYKLLFLTARAQALVRRGALAEAAALLAEMEPLLEKEEEWHIRGAYAAAQGFWLLAHDRLAEAAGAFQRAGDCFAQEGSSDFVVSMQSFRAYALWRMGEAAEALALSATAVAALEQTNGGENIQHIYWHHSQILGETGQDAAGNPSPASRPFLEKAYRTIEEQADSLPDEAWRARVWAIPLHCQVRAAWEAAQPRRARVWLPKLETAVAGRTAVDQTCEIEWTPYDPADAQIADKVARRRRQLARLLAEAEAQGARPTIADLAAALDSSQPTIKRDLAALRQA